jgi:uncharacterized oxidoreductase
MDSQNLQPAPVALDALRVFAAAVLTGAGCDPAIADEVATALVEADCSGRDSHGTRLLGDYVRQVRKGTISGTGRPRLVSQEGAVLRIAGDGAFGQIVGVFGVDHGVRLAKRLGVALVAITGSAHLGWNTRWPALAAEAGVASIHFANIPTAPPRIAPHGGNEPRLGTNPIALGAPGPQGAIVLDFASSAVSANTVKLARERGQRLDTAAVVAADGSLSDDPEVFFSSLAPTLAPFGGFKGYGLALFAEILAGALTGGGVQTGATVQDGPPNNLLSVYIDVASLTPLSDYAEDMRRLAQWVKSATPRDPSQPVMLPGERSQRLRAAAQNQIMLGAHHRAALDRAADSAGVARLATDS